ncbi:MAG TPA: response regulator transcription factor [Candidatus Binatia bacterium]|nr:response regulator transcription factor [Candidatus Binatia bacterium]
MDKPLRVIIADDHALFREGLASLLRLHSDLTVVGETASASDLLRMVEETPCDIVLLDLGMERNSLADISTLAAKVRVVVVTASEQPQDALDALRSGASAVVFKRFAAKSLMEAIRTAADGNAWMPPTLQTYAVGQLRAASRDPVTPREREIIRYVALGLRNAEVAKKLFISEVTVKTHLNNIFQKLDIRDRVELTLYAARVGIIGVHERPS